MSMRKYANDYEIVTVEDENGREKETIVYRGKYFESSLENEGLIRFKRISLLLVAMVVIFHISGGFVSNRGMYQMVVALPYALAFFPLIYLIEGIFRLPQEKRKFRRDEIGRSFERISISSYYLFAFLGVGLLGEIVFLLFIAEKHQRMPEFLYFVLELVAGAAAFFLIRLQKKIKIQPSEEDDQAQTP